MVLSCSSCMQQLTAPPQAQANCVMVPVASMARLLERERVRDGVDGNVSVKDEEGGQIIATPDKSRTSPAAESAEKK